MVERRIENLAPKRLVAATLRRLQSYQRDIDVEGSWELNAVETPKQFRLFAYALLDSAEALTKSLITNEQAKNFLMGNPVLYLARHAVELYLKGAILTRNDMKRPHHELESSAEQYASLFADDARCAWDIPFRVQVLGFDPQQIESVRKEHLKRFPGDQRLRYPADRTMKPWSFVATFDATTFERQIAAIRRDFERLDLLIFPENN